MIFYLLFNIKYYFHIINLIKFKLRVRNKKVKLNMYNKNKVIISLFLKLFLLKRVSKQSFFCIL